MKTKQFFTVIVALVFATNVFATETPKMNIIPLKDTKALVAVEHETSVNEITITDETGKIRYYKKSKNEMDGYKKIFDLSQLDEGSYEVMLKAGNITVKRNLCIEKGNVTVKQSRIEMDPYFSYANNILKGSYLN
jgi:YbbR domain-containing protein